MDSLLKTCKKEPPIASEITKQSINFYGVFTKLPFDENEIVQLCDLYINLMVQ
ncbi:MAG: hypothetical protein LBI69_02530 [Puniceicoccales bacterium]|nr:hypothetical protein [Puniceicoccales bacterium]